MQYTTHAVRSFGIVGVILAGALSGGCVTTTAPVAVVSPSPPAVDTRVEFYPEHGQSPDQQSRDKFECNDWAVKHSGFDPSLPSAPPHLQYRVATVEPPAGAGVAAGAVGGALIGATVSRPWESGQGALLGAIAGAVIGGIADSERLAQARAAAATGSDTTNERAALLEQMAGNYRRAMSACLEGRGYAVR